MDASDNAGSEVTWKQLFRDAYVCGRQFGVVHERCGELEPEMRAAVLEAFAEGFREGAASCGREGDSTPSVLSSGRVWW